MQSFNFLSAVSAYRSCTVYGLFCLLLLDLCLSVIWLNFVGFTEVVPTQVLLLLSGGWLVGYRYDRQFFFLFVKQAKRRCHILNGTDGFLLRHHLGYNVLRCQGVLGTISSSSQVNFFFLYGSGRGNPTRTPVIISPSFSVAHCRPAGSFQSCFRKSTEL